MAPFPNPPAAGRSRGDQDCFVDESLIQRMIGDGRLAVKPGVDIKRCAGREVRPQAVPVGQLVMGSWI